MDGGALVFISYARRDGKDAADTLRVKLSDPSITGVRLNIWQDLVSMRTGNWWQQIEHAIKTGDHLVMVVTAGALQSKPCEDEWWLARTEGKGISPILLPGSNLAPEDLPSFMRAQHIYRLDFAATDFSAQHDWIRLIDSLKLPPRTRKMPTISRLPDARFVERKEETDRLCELLTTTPGKPIGITTAFAGSGGMGKTQLALALGQDRRLWRTFHDGQLLVEFGQLSNDPKERESQLVLRLAGAIRDLTGGSPEFDTTGRGAEDLAKALERRRILLVLDDVWDKADLDPFLRGGEQCARLVTTRNVETLPPGAHRRLVDQMTLPQSMTLLTKGLPEEALRSLPKPTRKAAEARLAALANRLGLCAQPVALANGRLETQLLDLRDSQPSQGIEGWMLKPAIDALEIAYSYRGLLAFDNTSSSARQDSYEKCIKVSLDPLSLEHQQRFKELAIFPEDADIPEATIYLLWEQTSGDKLTEAEARGLLERLKRLSLAKGAYDRIRNAPMLRLHDVIRTYLRDQFRGQPDELAKIHGQLWCAHARFRERAFAKHTAQAYYAYVWLPQHLHDAGNRDQLDALLLDPHWLQAKLSATHNPFALVADYQRFGHSPFQKLIGRTLRLITGICTRDPAQLLPQLHGRLMASPDPAASIFLRDARRQFDPPVLVTQCPSLTPPSAEIARLEGHQNQIYDLALLSDGRLASCSRDHTVRIWSLESGAEIKRLIGHTEDVMGLAMLSDGQLASCSYDKTIRLWDIVTGKETGRLTGHDSQVMAIAVLPNGRLASASNDKTIRIWDVSKGAEIGRLTGQFGGGMDLAALPDGRLASVSSNEKTIQLWNIHHGAEIGKLIGHSNGIKALVVLPDGRLVSGSDDNTIRVWDLNTGGEVMRLGLMGEGYLGVSALALLTDGRLAAYSFSHDISIWDLQEKKRITSLRGHDGVVAALQALPNGRLASGSSDRTIRLWDLDEAATDGVPGHTGWVTSLAFLGDGQLASGSTDSTIKLWSSATCVQTATLDDYIEGGITALATLPDGRLVAGSSEDTTIRIWNVHTKTMCEELEALPWDVRDITALVVLSDGRLAAGASDSKVRIWDPVNKAVVASLEPAESNGVVGITALATLPDGRLASASESATITIWDVKAASKIAEMRTAELTDTWDEVNALALLPDGLLASGADDGAIRLWDTASWAQRVVIRGHRNKITALAIMADGHLASASVDNTIRVWDLATGAETARLEVDAQVLSLVGLPDGRLVAGDGIGRLHWLEVLKSRPS